MNVVYARVSTTSQNLENQIDQLKNAGCNKLKISSFMIYRIINSKKFKKDKEATLESGYL